MRKACNIGSFHSYGNLGSHPEDSQVFLAIEDVDGPRTMCNGLQPRAELQGGALAYVGPTSVS